MAFLFDTEPRLRLGLLIRYAYSGLQLLLIAAYLIPAETKSAVESLGPILAPLVALALGVAVYVLYKEFLGELVLYPTRHLLHTLAARIRYRVLHKTSAAPGTVGSVPALLGSLHVPFGQRQWAYRCLRTTRFITPERNQLLDLLHSEIHIIYVSAIQLTAAGIYRAWHLAPSEGWLLAALVLLVVAFIVDWRMDFLDAAYIRSHRTAVAEELRSLGFEAPGGSAPRLNGSAEQ